MTGNRIITIKMAVTACAIGLSGVYTLTLPTKAQAAVYKCIDADDNVTYSQVPCYVEERAESVVGVKSNKSADVDCRIANNFARQIATRMRTDQSSHFVFDSYGGIDAIPSTAIGIINYVYSHKNNIDTGSQRITALSAARCSVGSYGSVSCDDFPYQFIAELGGCERATMSISERPSVTTSGEQISQPVQEDTIHATGDRTSANEKNLSTDCQQDAQTQLSNLFNQMRTGQSASKQGQLESQKKALRDKLSNC